MLIRLRITQKQLYEEYDADTLKTMLALMHEQDVRARMERKITNGI